MARMSRTRPKRDAWRVLIALGVMGGMAQGGAASVPARGPQGELGRAEVVCGKRGCDVRFVPPSLCPWCDVEGRARLRFDEHTLKVQFFPKVNAFLRDRLIGERGFQVLNSGLAELDGARFLVWGENRISALNPVFYCGPMSDFMGALVCTTRM